ncbi:MAG TPA: hypothetical protein VG755_38620 [Nannocystaceae bacterium]|nr:hypothetical protein [Nannocystaceae bacterium]
MRAALAIVILALSCDRSEPATKAEPAAKGEPAAKAEDAAASCVGADVEKTLVDGCTDSPIQDSRKLMQVTWSPTHRGSLDGVPIVVTAKGAELFGQPFVADAVSSAVANRRGFAKPGEPAFVIAIDADAKLTDVQPVLEALVAAEATSGVLLYGSSTLPKTPAALHPEIHARITGKIEALDPAERAMESARELQTLAAPCAPLTKAFQAVATVEPTNRCANLMRAAVKAVASCNCPTWTPELLTWLQVLGGPADAPRIHADAVTLDRATPTKASKTSTWGKLVEGRTTAIDTLWLDLGA